MVWNNLVNYFKKLYVDSGIKDDVNFIYNSIPFNKNFIIFIILLPISLLYFWFIFVISFFYLWIYIIIFFLKKRQKSYNIICIHFNNNFKNSLLYLLKEFFINFPKGKGFSIAYIFLKYFYKNISISGGIDLKIFSILFRRFFYFITFIPFIVLKINCIFFNKFYISLFSLYSSKKAHIDFIFLNLYLDNLYDLKKYIKNFKIIINGDKIMFNPPKPDNYNLKGFEEFIKNKEKINKYSNFGKMTNKIPGTLKEVKHYCKFYRPFNLLSNLFNIGVMFTETKSDVFNDIKGEKIHGFLEDSGSINSDINTFRTGPYLGDMNNNIIEALNREDILKIEEIKDRFSWEISHDIGMDKLVVNLDNKKFLNVSEITLKEFYIMFFNNLDDGFKVYSKAFNDFDKKNLDLKKSISKSDYEKLFMEDYTNYKMSNLSEFIPYSKYQKNYKNKLNQDPFWDDDNPN